MGWGIRNFVHTGVFDEISRFADVAVAASTDLVPYFESLREAGRIAWIVELSSTEKRLSRLARQARKAVLQGAFGISTARIKWQEKARGSLGLAWRSAKWKTLCAISSPWQLNALERFEDRVDTSQQGPMPQRPSVLVNCSPFDPRDRQLQRWLQHDAVPSIAVIPSWDNPSTKGCISTGVNRVLAWGSFQKRELERQRSTLIVFASPESRNSISTTKIFQRRSIVSSSSIATQFPPPVGSFCMRPVVNGYFLANLRSLRTLQPRPSKAALAKVRMS